MNGVRKSSAKRILTAIEYGNLSNDETERRIAELIEAEVAKTDSAADMELIDACQALLWQLHTHGTVDYESHAKQNYEKLMARIAKVEKHRRFAAIALRFVTVAAVILLFVGVRVSWFEHSNTPDGQQHIITGQEITVEMVQAAIAENAGKGSFETTNLNELQQILGFDPNIPEVISGEWRVSTCNVLYLRNNIQVTSTYNALNDNAGTLVYVENYYTSVEDSYLTFEQSDRGEKVYYGEQVVYFSNNMGRMIACWCKDNVIYEIGCRMDEEAFQNLVHAIFEGGIN